ncbi:MAG: hypothetical protein H8E63_10985, partial [Proteobacteria bacterium]|nr:hypothetical protein [Pseudomonadota bacterium]
LARIWGWAGLSVAVALTGKDEVSNEAAVDAAKTPASTANVSATLLDNVRNFVRRLAREALRPRFIVANAFASWCIYRHV